MAENIKCILMILSVAMIWSSNGLAQVIDTDYKIVEPNDVPGVLSMLAVATQANFEKIKTWEGRITKEYISTTRGAKAAEYLSKFTEAEPNYSVNEIQRLYNVTIEFKINLENNKFFSISDSNEPFTYVEPQNGNAYPANWGPEEQIFIVTHEYQIKTTPLSKTKDGVILSRLARKAWPGSHSVTDPRKVFYIGEKTLWLSLSEISQALQIPDIEHYGVVIKKKSIGDNITYRIEISLPGKDRPFSIVILSSDAGFNRTYIDDWYKDGSLRSKITTEFVKQQGVFLPRKWEMSQYYPDGGLMRQEECTIEHQQINIYIPNSTFSEFTYLHDGDKFNDEIAAKKFEYKNSELVEVEKKSE